MLDHDEFAKIHAALGGELVEKMIDRFFEIAPEKVEVACVGMRTQDLKSVERAAHSLLANAGSLGASGLVDLARKVQELAGSGGGTQLIELVDRLPASLAELRRELDEKKRSSSQ